MAVHELTTNEVKHGALMVPDGNVEVSWTIEDAPGNGRLVLKWTERHAPVASRPNCSGLGMTLIE